jgi:hypothetical protein
MRYGWCLDVLYMPFLPFVHILCHHLLAHLPILWIYGYLEGLLVGIQGYAHCTCILDAHIISYYDVMIYMIILAQFT